MKISQIIQETSTTAGSVAPVEHGFVKMQTRNPGVYGGNKVGNLLKGKKTNKAFANSVNESAEISETDLSEQDLIVVPGQGRSSKSGFVPHGQSRVDHEVEMARSDLFSAAKNAKKVYSMIKDLGEDEGLDGWVQEKIIKANDYLNTIREYLEGKQVQGVAEVQLTPMWQDNPEHLEYLKKKAEISRSTGLAVGDRVTLKDRPGFKGKIVHDWGGGDFTISGAGGGMSQSNNHRANARLIQKIQGVAEGLDSDQRARLDDLIDTYRTATDPSYDGYGVDDHYDPDEVLDQIRREFGDRVADQIEAGTDKMHFPRKDHDQGYDPMRWRKPIDRQTKAGKMYKQDSDYRKNTIKSRYRLSGKSATEGVAEGSNPEKVEVRFSAKEYAAMTPAQKAAKQQEWQQLKQQAKMRMQNFTLIDTDKERDPNIDDQGRLRKPGEMGESQLDELSPKALGSYVKSASGDMAKRTGDTQFQKGARVATSAFTSKQSPSRFEKDSKIEKRQAGIDLAVDKITGKK